MTAPQPAGPGARPGARRLARTVAAVVSLSLWPGTAASTAGFARQAVPLGIEEAKRKLQEVGAEKAWPSFAQNTDLLSLALSSQADFPSPPGAAPGAGKVASHQPYVTVFDDFLSPEECSFLRTLGQDRLAPAMVVQSGSNWYDTQTSTRSNEQVWLTQQEERSLPLLRHILKRMHRTARVPDEYTEALQIGRYNASTKYEAHIDTDPGNRVARPMTLIVYLSDVEQGGDTLFPGPRRDCEMVWHDDPTTGEKVFGAANCCNSPERDIPGTVRVNPKLGRAVLFFSHRPDGSVDKMSKHIGCPVVKGVKWIAQRWFRFEPYNRVSYTEGDGWDPRFDGAPSSPEERASSRHFRVLSDLQPRVYLDERFLSEEETAYLGDRLSSDYLAQGESDQVWLSAGDVEADARLRALAVRAQQLARLPPDAPLPGLRLRRLKPGASEPPHRDSAPEVNGEAQPATVVVFLKVAEEGGELSFTAANKRRLDEAEPPKCYAKDAAACCGQEHSLKVLPAAGDAVLIYSHALDGQLDELSEHLICPVRRGESLVAEWAFTYVPPKPERLKAATAPSASSQPLILFENQLESAVAVYWVPPVGAEVTMGDIPAGPGTSRSFNTHAGHVFRVRDPKTGALLDEVTANGMADQRHEVKPRTSEL